MVPLVHSSEPGTAHLTIDLDLNADLIAGVLTGPEGNRQNFYGWLEFGAAIDAIWTTAQAHAAPEPGPETTSPPLSRLETEIDPLIDGRRCPEGLGD
jgi:hypothetical protein